MRCNHSIQSDPMVIAQKDTVVSQGKNTKQWHYKDTKKRQDSVSHREELEENKRKKEQFLTKCDGDSPTQQFNLMMGMQLLVQSRKASHKVERKRPNERRSSKFMC